MAVVLLCLWLLELSKTSISMLPSTLSLPGSSCDAGLQPPRCQIRPFTARPARGVTHHDDIVEGWGHIRQPGPHVTTASTAAPHGPAGTREVGSRWRRS
jgi:hypothetical protein